MEERLRAACQELLRHGLPPAVPRELDDEHPFIPLAVDITGDVAATVFLRRLRHGALTGTPGIQTSVFQRRDGDWKYLGGSAGNLRHYPLAQRLPAASQHGCLRALTHGQTHLTQPRRFPWDTHYAFHTVLQASAEVHRLQTGTQARELPFHGYAVLAWPGRRGPAVAALAADGTPLSTLDLSRDPLQIPPRR